MFMCELLFRLLDCGTLLLIYSLTTCPNTTKHNLYFDNINKKLHVNCVSLQIFFYFYETKYISMVSEKRQDSRVFFFKISRVHDCQQANFRNKWNTHSTITLLKHTVHIQVQSI